jgi:mRNA interferase RelE/StbE
LEFSVIFDKKAAKELTKLPKDIRTRIFRKIVESKTDPFRFFEGLEGRKDYKLRVGDYRVIADIIKSEMRVEITKIGHKKTIYKKD